MLLSAKSFNVEQLYAIGQMSGESNNNDFVIERYKRKLRCSVRIIVIDEKEDLFVRIKAGI
jgi:hypothetical protein